METENMMGHTTRNIPEPRAILRVWLPFKKLLGVTSVHSNKDYAHARRMIDALIDEIGDDETHPLAEVLDYLADKVKTWEDKHVKLPEAEPREVLRFLMTQHNFKQTDLADCAPQSHISAILNGKRAISKDVAKNLAVRFHVNADTFL